MMYQVQRTIFNGKYLVYQDTSLSLNNCGIIDLNGKVCLEAGYENIFYSVGDWAIITKRYNVRNDPNDVFFGIIDNKLNMVIDPCNCRYHGYEGNVRLDAIIQSLYERKYGKQQEQPETNLCLIGNNSKRIILNRKIKYYKCY